MSAEAMPLQGRNFLTQPPLKVPDSISPGISVEIAKGKGKEKHFAWYHGEAAEKEFAASLNLDPKKPEDKQKVDTLGKVLDRFLVTEIKNIGIFTTSEGIAIPYTTINVTEFARSLRGSFRIDKLSKQQPPSIRSYTHQEKDRYLATLTNDGYGELGKIMRKTYLSHGGQLTEEARTDIRVQIGVLNQDESYLESGSQVYEKSGSPKPKDVTYVTFGSFLTPQNGGPFTYVEPSMRETLNWLGPILKAMDEGRDVSDVRVITLGSPFNDRWGSITEQYAKRVEQDPFAVLGASYAEFIESTLPEDEEARADAHYRLYGHSMGGRLATATAEVLAAKGTFSQVKDDVQNPSLYPVYIDSTPGWNKKKIPGQVSVGFGLFVAGEAMKNPRILKTPFDESKFLAFVEEHSEIDTLDDDVRKEQLPWKKAALGAIKSALSEPVTSSTVEVTHRRGTSDPVIYSARWNREMRSIAEETVVPVRRVEPLKTFEWATDGSHMLNGFYRQNDFEKWNSSLEILLGSRKNK